MRFLIVPLLLPIAVLAAEIATIWALTRWHQRLFSSDDALDEFGAAS